MKIASCLAIAIAAHGALGCASSRPGPVLPDRPVALRYRTLDGGLDSIGRLRGRVVLVTVVATWAATALLEVPLLKQTHNRYAKDGLEIVALAIDETPLAVQVFADKFEIPYAVGLSEDDRALMGPHGPFGEITRLPTSVLLDRDGLIVVRSDGMWDPAALDAAVQRLLATDPSDV